MDTQDDQPEIAAKLSTPGARTPGQPLTVFSRAVNNAINPDMDTVRSITLRNAPKHCKIAKHSVIRDRHTGQPHHQTLSLQTIRKGKGTAFKPEFSHSIMLSDKDGNNEIQTLLDFLAAVQSGAIPKATAKHIVMPAPPEADDEQALISALEQVRATGRYNVFADVLKQAAQDTTLFKVLLERAARDPQLFAEAAAALNLATYKNAVTGLKTLIEKPDVSEKELQKHLEEHPWLFGSEYSQRLPRRNWTTDEQQDFVLRRTTDGYIELIEIKTPLESGKLFFYDRSHDTWYGGSELSRVVAQVQKYIEELEADRSRVLQKYGEDTHKIRAKIIIGRDTDDTQKQALRRFNGHLHRIEVLTFDGLLRIAQNVLQYIEGTLRPVVSDSDDASTTADEDI